MVRSDLLDLVHGLEVTAGDDSVGRRAHELGWAQDALIRSQVIRGRDFDEGANAFVRSDVVVVSDVIRGVIVTLESAGVDAAVVLVAIRAHEQQVLVLQLDMGLALVGRDGGQAKGALILLHVSQPFVGFRQLA